MKYYRNIYTNEILNLILDDNTYIGIFESDFPNIFNNNSDSTQIQLHQHTFTKANIKSIEFLPSWNLTSIPDYFGLEFSNLRSMNDLPDSIKIIGNSFLHYCNNFNSSITLPSNLMTIGRAFLSNCNKFNKDLSFLDTKVRNFPDHFMSGCSSFNSTLRLPNNIESIGNNFLYNCSEFNKTIVFNYSQTSPYDIVSDIMYNNDSFTNTIFVNFGFISKIKKGDEIFSTSNSSAPCYTQGIKIKGTDISFDSIHIRLPDLTSLPYRKLIEK